MWFRHYRRCVMLNRIRELYGPKDLEGVWGIHYDLDGKVVSLQDDGENAVLTRDGENEFPLESAQIDILVASMGVIVGVDFRPAQVAEPDKCQLWVRR